MAALDRLTCYRRKLSLQALFKLKIKNQCRIITWIKIITILRTESRELIKIILIMIISEDKVPIKMLRIECKRYLSLIICRYHRERRVLICMFKETIELLSLEVVIRNHWMISYLLLPRVFQYIRWHNRFMFNKIITRTNLNISIRRHIAYNLTELSKIEISLQRILKTVATEKFQELYQPTRPKEKWDTYKTWSHHRIPELKFNHRLKQLKP